MRQARIITIAICEDYQTVYDYLAEPRNYAQWGGIEPDSLVQLASGDWQAMTQFGPRRVRFTPRNGYGVADMTIIKDDGSSAYTPMRVVPNGEGTHLTFTLFPPDSMDEAQIASTLEWIMTDLQVLKSLLEGRAAA